MWKSHHQKGDLYSDSTQDRCSCQLLIATYVVSNFWLEPGKSRLHSLGLIKYQHACLRRSFLCTCKLLWPFIKARKVSHLEHRTAGIVAAWPDFWLLSHQSAKAKQAQYISKGLITCELNICQEIIELVVCFIVKTDTEKGAQQSSTALLWIVCLIYLNISHYTHCCYKSRWMRQRESQSWHKEYSRNIMSEAVCTPRLSWPLGCFWRCRKIYQLKMPQF